MEKTPPQDRILARTAILYDTGLSAGARLLYFVLDDMAGTKGVCWPRQAILAGRLGCSERLLQYWLAELAGKGVRQVRTGRACRYELAWADTQRVADQGTSRVATGCVSDTQRVADRIPLNEPEKEPVRETGPNCNTCLDFGRKGGVLSGTICSCEKGQEILDRLKKRMGLATVWSRAREKA